MTGWNCGASTAKRGTALWWPTMIWSRAQCSTTTIAGTHRRSMSQPERHLARSIVPISEACGTVPKLREVAISVSPRLHLGLLSMHARAPRMNGGIGFAVDGPKATIEAKLASGIEVTDLRHYPMVPAELEQLRHALDNLSEQLQLSEGAVIKIDGAMQTHVGMGSATAIRLGALEALALINRRTIARDALVAASGRGGTSGIGVNSYFDGCLVCDLGRANDGGQFAPSSRACAFSSPLALPSVQMPAWPVLLCIPRTLRPKTQEEEIAFFARTAPLPAAASFEASYIALFEIYAAVIERDFTAFCRGVDHIQHTAWKRAERAEYGGNALGFISERLVDAGAKCVGMSSLGPMLFCLADPPHLIDIAATARDLDCDVHRVEPANRGRDVRIIHA